MDILDKIKHQKFKEIKQTKEKYPVRILEKQKYFSRLTHSIVEYIQRDDRTGIIAEFKRQSPSKGIINAIAKVQTVTLGYNQNGASGLSVLTDAAFFGGKNDDLIKTREVNEIPILKKDFIVDEYQIIEAKSLGADVILLIAECLTKEQVKSYAGLAKSLGMEVLMELHTEQELTKLCYDLDLVGVNNRNLKTFEVTVSTSVDLFHKIPDDFVKISESGINDPNTIQMLKEIGFEGFLIGENFMKTDDPVQAFKRFVSEI